MTLFLQRIESRTRNRNSSESFYIIQSCFPLFFPRMLKTVAGVQAAAGAGMARRMAEALEEHSRVGFARAFTAASIEGYWYSLQERHNSCLSLVSRAPALLGGKLTSEARRKAEQLGKSFACIDALQAGYCLGCIYTAALPSKYRSEYGAYYTPPSLSTRLMEMATQAGVDWKNCRVLDGSCGGAAFLAPVALKILENTSVDRSQMLTDLARRLKGFEIDPFAAWMSQVLVEAALLPFCTKTGARLPQLVTVCNSLDCVLDKEERFDLVIGNPPYGRTKLDPYQRVKFSRSLFGHANLYGVFTHAALGWVNNSGVIAYVTPTSMLGGEYYKALRTLLVEEAPPQAIELVNDREGIFEDVLQETMLAVYKRGVRAHRPEVRSLEIDASGRAVSKPSGTFRLPQDPRQAWIIPRTPAHAFLVRRLEDMHTRLTDYGYGVSTGPLVWNRHKGQFHSARIRGTFPVIWAEAVTSSGKFEWQSEKRGHLPWFKPMERDQWLLSRQSCVLVQRTTAKEQPRRLIVAELPASFVKRHEGVIVENHLNMVRHIVREPRVSTRVITALLKSRMLDEVFRCINGSVAVSAFEIESLPLPDVEDAVDIERMIREGVPSSELEQKIEKIYLGTGNAAASIA